MQQSIIGKVIDNYEITGILGKGGMGVVYRAKDMTLDRDVALKMMDAAFARDDEFLKRFKSEAKALAKLQNPNIVGVFALRETEIGLALVMEFVDGNTLADRIRLQGALPLEQTVPIFSQLLTALDHAHRAGIIHRDIKPGNVMMTGADIVKVTDFGLAKIQQVVNVTMTMGTGGTLYYMSPEQIRGLANVDARGDIYSLGMTLYECLTGRIPFGNDLTDFDIRQMIVEGKIPPPDRFDSSLSKEVVAVIAKSIAKDPEKRYQSAAEMLFDLEKIVIPSQTGKRSESKSIRPAPNLKKQKSAKRPLFITVGIGATLLLAYFVISPLLTTSTATLGIISDPAGSTVILNGSRVGSTPIEGLVTQVGSVQIRVDHEGFYVKDTVVTLSENQSVTLSVALAKLPEQKVAEQVPEMINTDRPVEGLPKETPSKTPEKAPIGTATLMLRTVPGGSVRVDGGARSGSDETLRLEVRAGEREILFENPTYGTERRFIKMNPGETKRLTCFFESYMSIVVSGDASGAMIVINGKASDVYAPIARFPIGPGKHKVTVTRFGFETLEGEKEIIVSPSFEEKVIPLGFTLKKNS